MTNFNTTLVCIPAGMILLGCMETNNLRVALSISGPLEERCGVLPHGYMYMGDEGIVATIEYEEAEPWTQRRPVCICYSSYFENGY